MLQIENAHQVWWADNDRKPYVSQATATSMQVDNANARHNAIVLSLAQAICGAAAPMSIAIGGLAGFYLLGTDKSLATAPVTGYNIGVALTAIPAAMLMGRIGRRAGFMWGAVVGILGMITMALALVWGNFWLFAVGMLLNGSSGAFTQQYRFAAADQGDPVFKAKAISWVLAGGIGAAVIGPQTIIFFKDLLAPVQFAGAYVAGIGLMLIGMLVLSFLRFDTPRNMPQSVDKTDTGRPLIEIVSQPRFIVAVICATGSYALMAFVMTGAPLAMVACGISEENATLGIQWHVMAMFAPSFFTGHLIARFGKERIVAAGLLILMACAAVALTGLDLWIFWLSLVLLGVGWNFGFIGATAMLTDCYEPNEKSKAQGANDFILFGTVAFASLMSGQTLNAYGWDMLNWVVFPVCAICLISLVWLSFQRKSVLKG